ncbi:LysR family transcriptional regulator [Ovoidimarina sediminis]|uniref:LysR family transcriptional regulator n=1 Tax=Ovoidimarina sediminis TaxID=3079856 RepID=UPI00293141AC|nr:LysR family transcriptional regulator [Rhodophyticola sp. MJ-SS7]
MQIELIETFLDLCETRNFNRTAERLGITQSTVSGRVQALERALGARLFRRSRSGTELTTPGLRFEPHARALRLSWTEATRAARGGEDAPPTLRLGIQHDLVTSHAGEWIDTLRTALPDAAFYVEGDFSAQICIDLMAGDLDFGILFTPKPHPDLHFESLGDVTYRMVSTETGALNSVRRETYILGNYSPAFSRTHAELLPHLSAAPVSSGQDNVVAGLLSALGGTAYLREDTGLALAALGGVWPVEDAPPIRQPVFAAVHLRNRHRAHHRRMMTLGRRYLAGDRDAARG